MAENLFLKSSNAPVTTPVAPPLPDFSLPAREAPSAPGLPSAAASLKQGMLPPPDLQPLFEQASATYGVPINVLSALADQESNYRTDAVGVETQWGKAKGIMQYLDSTAKGMGIDPFDAAQSIDAAAKQFKQRLDQGYSVQDAIAAHFGGDDRKQWGPKTAQYVQDVLSRAGGIDQEMMAGKILGEAQAQQEPDLAALQAQADAEEPGRYKVVKAEDAQHWQRRADIASGKGALKETQDQVNGFDAPSPYTLENQQRFEDQVDARPGIAPLTLENQTRAKKGMALRDTREAKPLGALATTAEIGQQLWDAAAYHLPAAVAGALEGDDPYAQHDWKDGLIERSRARSQAGDTSLDAKTETALPGVNKADLKSLGPSLGFSGVGMAAGLAAGLPAGAAGSLAGPVAGTAAAYTAGGTASGAAAYRMSTNQFVRDLREAADLEAMKGTGRKLSDAEFAAKMAPLMDEVNEYGLWEAVPEAVSNVIGFGALKAGVKGAIGRVFGKNVVTRLASKAATVYGAELATETVTQQGQHNVSHDVGLTNLPKRSWTSAADLGESFKEIAAVTVLQTTLMAGGTKGAMMLQERIKRAGLTPAQYDALMEINDALDRGQFDPESARQQAILLLDPNTYLNPQTGPGEQIWKPGEKPAAPIMPAAAAEPPEEPAAPAGPLTAAASKVQQTEGAERVTVQTPTGPITGTMESFQAGEKDQWEARVLGDDGQFYQFSSKDDVEIIRDGGVSAEQENIPTLTEVVPTLTDVVDNIPTLTEQVPTLTDVVKEGNIPTLTEQVPTLTDVVKEGNIPTLTEEVPTLTDVVEPDYAQMAEPELRAELKATAAALKETPKDPELKAKRKAIEKAINNPAPTVEPKAEPAPAPAPAPKAKPELPLDLQVSDAYVRLDGAKTPEEHHAIAEEIRALKKRRKAEKAALPASHFESKWFGSRARAEGYLHGSSFGETHEVVEAGKARFEIRPKAAAPAVTELAGKPIDQEWTRFADDSGSLNIPRANMPQIKAEHRGAMVNFLNARGIAHTQEEIPAGSLKPTQEEFSPAKVEKAKGFTGGDRSILVSRDGHVLDGHHQWLAKVDGDQPIKVIRLDAPIAQLLDTVREFPSAETADGATPAVAPPVEAPAVETTAAPAKRQTPKEKAKAVKAKRQEQTRATLGVKEGEQFTMSADVGYATTGDTYTLTSIASDGEAYITNVKGSRTSLSRADLIRAVNQGVTFTRVGDASNTEAEKPASTSTAPEHANVGADDRELADVVAAFNDAHQGMQSGEDQIHHLFDVPGKREVVRLADKVKVYQKDHGWMTPAEAKAKIADWKAHTLAQYDAHRQANSQKVVLSFFDLTGKWSQPWEEAGYQVYRFDIQADPEMGNVNNFSTEFFNDWFGDFEGADVYAILAACPCTDFAVSGARHFAAKDADGRTVASVKLVHQTLAAIEHFKPSVWAIENPVGRIEKLGGLPPWRLSFDPYHLGDTYTKKTLIWGRFNGDLPIAPVEPVEGSKMHSQYGGKSLATKNARSATPEGFAYGFFMANNAIDNPVMAIANKYDRLDREVIGEAVDAGMTEGEISEVVDDFYYMDLDDAGANQALSDAIAERTLPAVTTNGPAIPKGIVLSAAQKREMAQGGTGLGGELAPATMNSLAAMRDNKNLPDVRKNQDAPAIEVGNGITLRGYRRGTSTVQEINVPNGMSVRRVLTDAGDLYAEVEGDYEQIVEGKGFAEVEKAFRDFANLSSKPQKPQAIMPPAPAPAPAEYGANNKLVSQDRAAELRAKLKAKFNGSQLNSGLDPEILALGTELAVFHLEAGVRKFAQFAKTMADDLGQPMEKVRPFLRAWFNGARDLMEDQGVSIEGIDSADTVRAELAKLDTPAEPDQGARSPAEMERLEAGMRDTNVFPDDQLEHLVKQSKIEIDVLENRDTLTPKQQKLLTNHREALATAEKEQARRKSPRAKKTATKGDMVLTQDWGVQHIDGYGDGTREIGNATKDAFLKEARTYLKAVADVLAGHGYEPHLDRKGNPEKPVSVNEAGPAVSGDVSLTLQNKASGTNVYITIGDSALGGMTPATRSGIAIMYRVGQGTDRYAKGAGNTWAPVDLSANDLAELVNSRAPKQPKVNPDEPQPTETAGAANADGRQPGAGQSDGTGANAGAAAEQSDGGLRPDRGQRKASGDQPARPDAGPATPEHQVPGDSTGGPATGARADQRNYRIQPGELKRTGSWKATAEQNVKIVELVKQILGENRQATPEEKALLTKFTGWGASEIANGVFPNQYGRYKDDAWQALGQRLQAAMTPDEYAQAKRTTQYAHYTSEPIIRSVYSALERLGFNGGQVLEPGAGIGLFNGLMPDAMAANGSYTGIEYDTFTGNIAKLLYPQSNIIVGDYTQTKLPREFFDAAIGNPPFGQIKVLGDPEYKKQGFLLHDYFFAKTIDRVKPGGLQVFVTSKGTMDKASDRARKYLMERADLLGAIRLPQTAFKDNAGTEVVTDVLFLRKRAADELPAGEAWGGLAEVSTKQGPAMVNEYFAAHPQMVLGRHAKTGSMYRADEYTVEPIEGDIEQLFAKAIEQLPEGVYRPQRGSPAEKATVQRRDYDPKVKKEGGVYVAADGTLMQVENGQGTPLTQRTGSNGQAIELKPRELEWLKGYTRVRDALKQTQYDQLNDGPWEASLKALNKAYDAFTKEHGALLAHTVSEREGEDGSTIVTRRFKNEILIRQDAEGALAYALEQVGDNGTVSKGPVLLGRTLNKPATPVITGTQDALFVSLNDRGRFDLAHIAQLAGKTEAQVIEDLGTAIYQDPSAGWTTADDYLSGNVVRKLKEAEAAARLNKDYARNIEPLKNVQPRALAPQDITVQLGSAWVPPTDVKNFAAEVMGDKFSISYSAKIGQWAVLGTGGRVSEWGTRDRNPAEVLEAVLNNRQLKATYKDAAGKTYTDPEGTEKLNDIAKKLRAAFKRWIWSDATRSERLARYYNENFNNIAAREFDGSHLTLPGVSARFNLRPHQKRAIWRTVQQGDTYYAHAVGAGKTFTMIASGMEERRLGLSKKPMYVVPNHMLAQFSKEFLELYPTAQIMVADEQNFHTHNRRKFVAQAALNDPDAIVITHSAFGRIGMSTEYSKKFISAQIDDWQTALRETDSMDRVTVKQIERRIEQLDNRLKKILAGDSKDKVLSFEELGVDRLYVDEGHEFRKLDFPTNRGNIKGIDSAGSQRAMDLYMKVSYLHTKNPGRALVMASGTPVTNTMGELFTIQRFFQRDQLEEDGDASFDAWANHYGEVVDGLEQNAAGGYESVSRFAKFVNVPELMSRVRSFMDILTSAQLGDLVQRPDVDNGGRQVVVTPPPDGYKAYQKELESRIKKIRERRGPPLPGDDIILSVISDGRFSAIDMRFVDPDLPSDPNSKLNVTIDAMLEAYHSTASNEYSTSGQPDALTGASLMMFTDIGLGEQSAKSRGFDMKAWIEKRLIEGGVKPEHIAFMRDHKAHSKKERLFDDLRQGRKRILIGGKDMETGVNAQKRLTHLFHLDAPWFPASVEQREGRIIRQGNQNARVTIKAFASKGSYDSTMWGMNARKARFIEQAMSGDSSLRAMEDVSEASAFEMASALASGDERYMKLAGLKGDVERLSRLYSAHIDDQRRLRSEKMGTEFTEKYNLEQVALIKAAIAQREPIKAGEFAGTVGTTTYDKRDEFSAALHAQFKGLAEMYIEGEQTVGRIGGFPIVYNGVLLRKDDFAADLSVSLPGDLEPLITYPIDPDVSVAGIATRAANQVNGLEYQLGKREDQVTEARDKLAKIARRLGASFPEQSELDEKSEQLDSLERELEAESKAGGAAMTEVAASTAEVEAPRMILGQGAKWRAERLPKLSVGQADGHGDVSAALTQGPFGPVVRKLLDAGLITLHADASTLPGAGQATGVQAATTADGHVHLVAANLSPATVQGVLLHEMFHKGGQSLLGNARWSALVKRLGALRRQAEQSQGKARSVYDKAAARVAAAQRQGAVANGLRDEEFGAYAIEEYEQLPAAFGKWVDDLVGTVKHWLFSRFGRQLGQVTPAQLRALAKEALLSTASGPRGPDGTRFSTSPLGAAFQRWFGKSKVVDGQGQPLAVYHGTANDFTTFSDEFYGESTGVGDLGEGFYFTDRPEIASSFAEDADGDAPHVMPVYLAIQNPATNKVINSPEIQDILEDGMGFDSLRDVLREQGYDGIIYTHKGAGTEYVAFDPEQIKSAIGNNGEYSASNPDIRFSVLEDATALDDAIEALDAPKQLKPDVIGQLADDIGRVARFVLHPRQIASLHKPFTPVYRTAIAQFEMRDALIDQLQQHHKAYDDLPQASKTRVNAVLELGRLYSASYPEKALKDGIGHVGKKTVAKFDDEGKSIRVQEPVHALLSQVGEVHKLDAAEIEAYMGLRAMFDEALEKFKDQTLVDFGLPELAGQKDAAKQIMAMINPNMAPAKRDRLQGIVRFIEEIEQAKRTGYVPFARYGDYVVVVKQEHHPLKLIQDTINGGWITRDLPMVYNKFLKDAGAKFDKKENGFRLDDALRDALVSENEQTIHSAKVEFTLQDKLLIKRGRKVTELPSVKKALATAEKWKDGKPNRRVIAFEPIQKKPEGGVKLADVDALAEVAMLDTATWDAVREQLGDAIKGKSFRKHFFQSSNVPGYTADFERSIADYMAGMSGYLARRHYNQAWDNAVSKIKAPRLFEYATKYRAYANEPHEELAMVRQVGFFSYIAGVPATALVNLTQPALLTVPVLNQVAPTHLVLREMARAYKDALAMARLNKKTGLDFFDPDAAPADVRSDLRKAWAEGMFVPLQTYEVMATSRTSNVKGRKLARQANKVVQVTASLFSFAERLNRLVTFITAARLATRPAVKANARKVYADNPLAMAAFRKWSPLSFADFMIDETQFRMGKANRPVISRGIGAALMQFKGFVMQSLEVWFRLATQNGLAGVKAAALSIGAMALVGGLWGMPGADDLRDAIEATYKQVTKQDLDLKTELRQQLYEVTGQRWIAEVATKGATYPFGLDLSRVGMGSIAPDSPLQVFGIPADLFIGRPSRAFGKASQGDAVGAVGEFLPNFLKNPVTAYGWSQNGIRDGVGRMSIGAEDVTAGDLGAKVLGFQPPHVTNTRDYEYAQRRMETGNDLLKRQYLSRIAKTIARAEKHPDEAAEAEAEREAIHQELAAYNDKAAPEDRIILTRSAVQNRIRQEMGGVQETWGRERKQARGASQEMREAFGLEQE